ncbi:HU family DNA-binding protein [Pelagibacteraceae bacterium]|nr:HU family DNA-binding protein [Pelagibacteraceae bacterium]
MSRSNLIKILKKKHPKLSKKQIANLIDIFVSSVRNALIKGNSVELRNPSFGTFFTKKIKEKKNAINPKTQESIFVPEKNKIRFRPSKKLIKMIN